MKTKYDVLVIGGGPAGAVAAKTAAEKGLSACLVEKRPAIGAPVRCAEGIGRDALAEFIDPDPKFISASMTGAAIVAPDGFVMKLESALAGNKVGYILDRKIFDRELVWQAAEAGAEVMVKTRASAPLMADGKVKGAVVDFCGRKSKVHAGITIAADGVESKFSRWCGIDTVVDHRQAIAVDSVETRNLVGNHARVADHRPQRRMRKHRPLGADDIAVIAGKVLAEAQQRPGAGAHRLDVGRRGGG